MDNTGNKALRDLGIFYCGVYVVSLVACSLALWVYWNEWRLDNLLTRLGDVITVSAGAALLATILKEALWFMVLAAMKIKEWQDRARKEERERLQRRQAEAYEKFGFEVDGVLVLPRTPEVESFLAGEEEK